MDAIKKAIEELKKMNGEVNSKIIEDLIKSHSDEKKRMQTLYDEYTGKVPIKKRESKRKDGINNKIANDFRGYIVDTMSGYLFGNPITYTIKGKEEGKEIDKVNEFNIRNSIDNMDSITGKMTGAAGSGSRLLFVDDEGMERIANVDPWETIFVHDGTLETLQYAMRYYQVEVIGAGDNFTTRTRVEWYDKVNVTFYMQQSNDGFELDDEGSIPHMFDGVPLLEFPNNRTRQGDFEKVISLIDGYDRDVSFDQDEHEAFRNAYLIMKGMSLNTDEAGDVKDTGTINVPEEGDASYLTKDVNDDYIEHHKNRLQSDIHKFSRIPDMSDETFSGDAQSGESRKWKLMGMETKAGEKERMFIQSLRQMYKLLTGVWAKKNVVINYLDMEFQFSRNLPVELKHEAETTNLLRGNISEKTRLGLLTFVEDVEQEQKQMEEDTPTVDLDTVPDNEGDDE